MTKFWPLKAMRRPILRHYSHLYEYFPIANKKPIIFPEIQ